MKTLDLIQGSPEWLAHRAAHRNASDAPTMLGLSPYKTRTEFLNEVKTGITPEVDDRTQARFDEGHAFEALARPLAEKIIGQELFPVVGTKGKLSASYDGLTMAEDEGFEHKRLNATLRGIMVGDFTGADLPIYHRVQMEQQLEVCDGDRILFMASEWDGDKLVEERHCWYYSDPELRQRVLAGWAQFEADLENHVPVEVIAPPVAKPQLSLPAVSIQVNGRIALVDNLSVFGTALTAYVERINKKPETDQDFADLEATVKTLKNAEEALDAAENGALAQTDSIDTMRRTVGLYRDTARTNRLLVEKLVKSEKENRRNTLLGDVLAELVTHYKTLNTRLGKPWMPAVQSDFPAVIKGLKSLDSMKDKLATELARCKSEANQMADRIAANLETKGLHGYATLFPDLATLCHKAPDDFQNTVSARITAHEKEIAEKAAATPAPSPAPANLPLAAVVGVMPASVRQAMAPVPAAKPDTPPGLKLGVINERIAPMQINAAGLAQLGFEVAARDRSAVLYHEADFPLICRALIEHLESVCELQAA